MLIDIAYNRERAVEYARRWAMGRSPLFADFSAGGGNCTNFVSQVLLAGSGVMDFTRTFGWYYRSLSDRAPAWTGVDELFGYLTGSGDFEGRSMQGPYATLASNRRQVEIGDVVQLANSRGEFYHSLIVSGFSGGDILVCAHSDDALDRPLSSYNYASLRVLHIEGVFLDVPLDECFTSLIDGTALLTVRTLAENADEAGE